MFGMALTRPSLTMQLTSGMDVFAHVWEKADTSINYCDSIWPYDRGISVFVKCDMIFRLFFFGNYHNFKLLTFAKVMWQHTEGMVGSIIWVLLEIYLLAVKDFENPLRIDKVIAMSSVYYFFGTQYRNASVKYFFLLYLTEFVNGS